MDRILVVEDERAMREIIRDYLTAHGLECDLARDGQEALELLEEQDYDAVVLDVLMPRLDGFGVCRAVRRQSSVPILFLTALGGEEETLRGYALGADDYVTKPFSLAVLLAKLQALIRRSRYPLLRGHPGRHRRPPVYGSGTGNQALPPRVRAAPMPSAQSGAGALPRPASGQGVGAGL